MPCEPYRGGTARGGCWPRSGGLDRGGRAQPSREGGEVGLMRTRGLRWTGVLLAWAALTPSVGRTQTGDDGQASSWWPRWTPSNAPTQTGSNEDHTLPQRNQVATTGFFDRDLLATGCDPKVGSTAPPWW